jgi:hypothetical protein
MTGDAYYGNPEAPLRGHMFFRWLTDPGTGKVNAGHYDLLTPSDGGTIKLPQDAPVHFSPSSDEATWDWGNGESSQGNQEGDPHKPFEPEVVDPSGKGAKDTGMEDDMMVGKDVQVESEPKCAQGNEDTADTKNLFGGDSDTYWEGKEQEVDTPPKFEPSPQSSESLQDPVSATTPGFSERSDPSLLEPQGSPAVSEDWGTS